MLCKLLGHEVRSYDDRYPVCSRCGAHGYYNDEAFSDKWHWLFIRLYWWLCSLFRKLTEWQIQHTVGKDEDIPF